MKLDRRTLLQSLTAVASVFAWPRSLFAAVSTPDYPVYPWHSAEQWMKVQATMGSGTVTLQVWKSDGSDGLSAVTDTTLQLLLVADKPDGSRVELGVVMSPYQLTVPRSALPANGWVSLTGVVVLGTEFSRFRVQPLYLGGGGSKLAPLIANRGFSEQFDCGRVDWLAAPDRYTYPSFQPYVLKPIPSQNGVAPKNGWVCERPWGAGDHGTYIPRWRKIGGVVQAEQLKAEAGSYSLGASVDHFPYFPTYGGVPGLTNTTPFATVRGHPSGGRGPMWIELDGYGRFWGYNRDGTVIGMGGNRMPVDLYEIPDETLSTFKPVGTFTDGPLKHPHDFAYDYIDRKYFYVADTDNDRLVRVSRHAGVVTGQPEDFSKWVFSAWGPAFSHPTSIDSTKDGKIYVVDSTGLWSVNRGTGAKKLLLADTRLFWVRCLSNGLVCTTSTDMVIKRIDPSNGSVTSLAVLATNMEAGWPVISPDLSGQIGPKDSLYFIGGAHASIRIDQDGTVTGSLNSPFYFQGGGGYANVGDLAKCLEAFHYAWNCEVHPEEPYVFARGFKNSLPALYRPKQASEDYLSSYDYGLAAYGRSIMPRGTIDGFPWGARPSFTSLMTEQSYNGLGLKMFDDIQAMPLADRIAWVKGGMGGSVPRPEIVGEHLRGFLYWIWRNSRQFVEGKPLELPPEETDKAAPVISNVRVTRSGDKLTWTWKTDRPALCYVRFANRVPMYRWTPLENEFTTDHTAVGSHVDHAVSYQICALASNGVLTEGQIATVGASGDTTPPQAPLRLR